MSWRPRWWRRDEQERQLDAELRDHLERQTRDYVSAGMSRTEADRRARMDLGGLEQVKESSRETLPFRWIDDLAQDLRYAARSLARSPGFASVAVLTLALGVGANTAIFSVVNAVLLRPLTLAGADRVVIVWETFRSFTQGNASVGHFHDWTEQGAVFEATAATVRTSFNLEGDGEPERLNGSLATPGFFEVAHIAPALGRYFTQRDVEAGGRVVVLGHGLWQRRFGGDAAIVGLDVRLGGASYTVVGIAPAGYDLGAGSPELWAPLIFAPDQRSDYGSHSFLVMAKLRPGVSLDAARADMERVTRGIAERHPEAMESRGVHVQPFREFLIEDVRSQLLALLAAGGFVLLIACANLSSLLLARGSARHQEIAIRLALGSGRLRIVRQLLTESMVLAGAGGVPAIAFAWLGVGLLRSAPMPLPRLQEAGLQADVLLFALTATLAAGALFGLAPAVRTARADTPGRVRQDGRQAGFSGARDRLRGALVVGEIAVTFVLLVGAGLSVRSLLLLQEVPLGFDPAGVLVARVTLPAERYPDGAGITNAVGRILDGIRAAPSVERVSASSNVPLLGREVSAGTIAEGTDPGPDESPDVQIRLVSEDYFETSRVPLRSGRSLRASDMAAGVPRVTVVNERLAAILWPGEDAVGQRLSAWSARAEPEWRDVVGVVGDVRTFGRAAPVVPELFLPYTQAPDGAWNVFQSSVVLVVRTAGEPGSVTAALRDAVRSVDPALPIYDLQSMGQLLSSTLAPRRFGLLLLAWLASAGLTLAAVGIYGVTTYIVTLRTPEIGLRMTLGATPGAVLVMVLRHGAGLALLGIGAGIVAAVLVTPLVASQLFGVSPTDPVSYMWGAAGLLGVALLASALPAIRACRTDPVRSLSGS